jgi:hypothetical protein
VTAAEAELSDNPFCKCGHAAWWHDYNNGACKALVVIANERKPCACEKYRSDRMTSLEAEKYRDDD